MSRNQIKYIAAAAMLLDHIAAFLLPAESILFFIFRTAGRLTAPIMCFFLAEGFRYTSSKKKYGIRLFIFAVISQFPYAFANSIPVFSVKFNVIFTLFISFLILQSYENIQNNIAKTAVIFLLIAASTFADWGIIVPLWTLTFHIFHNDKKRKITAYAVISFMHIIMCVSALIAAGNLWHSQLWQSGVFLFIPVFLLYNEKSGSKNLFSKWFFYIFYPLHLSLLGIASKLL